MDVVQGAAPMPSEDVDCGKRRIVTPARPADADAVRELQVEARAWLAAAGSDQWSVSQTNPNSPHGLAAAIGRGEVYVVRDAGSLVGTLTLDDYADPEFWVEEDDPGDALYVHRMIVARSAAGANLGGWMLDWAADVAWGQGKRWLRLDAWRSNLGLQAYYERQGFTHVRTMNLPHRGSGALFQRVAHPSASSAV